VDANVWHQSFPRYLILWLHSDYLVTKNLRDFTGKVTENYHFIVMPLDEFLCDLLDTSPTKFNVALVRALTPMRKKGGSVHDIIKRLGKPGDKGGNDCPETSGRLMAKIGAIEAAVNIARQKRYG